MRRLEVIVLVLMSCVTASGQSLDAEMTKLREFLKLPAETQIVPSTANLPNITPLKVFVATGQDKELNKVFVRRISEWNRKNGAKHGVVDVVPDISEAQIVLAWYSIPIEKVTHPPDDTPAEYRFCCPERGYSYLILRSSAGLEILKRIVIEGYSLPGSSDGRGGYLRDEFFKRLKARKWQ